MSRILLTRHSGIICSEQSFASSAIRLAALIVSSYPFRYSEQRAHSPRCCKNDRRSTSLNSSSRNLRIRPTNSRQVNSLRCTVCFPLIGAFRCHRAQRMSGSHACKILRETQIQCPIESDPHLLFEPWELEQVNCPPKPPGNKSRKLQPEHIRP